MIYLVREHEGSYEDYHCSVIKAFSNKDSADRFIEEYNLDLAKKIEQSNKCEICPYPDIEDKVINKDLFISKCSKKCANFKYKMTDSNSIYVSCRYLLWDKPDVDIQEIELEE